MLHNFLHNQTLHNYNSACVASRVAHHSSDKGHRFPSGSFPASGTDLALLPTRYAVDDLLKSKEVKVMPFSLVGPQRMWTLYYNLQSDQVAQSF